ncbi:MAG: multidrug effflux MFS transporter [Sphingomonadales bacterium]|nr:multidrug effflux MFS transporter [Sphingomonadales bacterium]
MPSPAKTDRRTIGEREFIWMVAMIMALNGFAIDTMLPAFPDMADGLKIADRNDIQFVISTYLFANAAGSLVIGPLSDRIGRRPLLLGSIAGYMLFSILSGMAQSYDMLLGLRIAHGLCGGGLGVLAAAIVRDRFSGDRMARIMSTTFLIFMVVPVLAPSVGQVVLWVADWRAIFILFGVAGAIVALWVWIRFPESLDPANVVPLQPRQMLAAWNSVIRHRTAIAYMLGGGILQGAMFGFLNSSQQVIADAFGAKELFTLCTAFLGIGMALGNFTNARIVERFGARRVSHSAVIAFILMGAAQLAGHWIAPQSLLLFLLLLIPNMALAAFVGANFSSIAMQPFGAFAGAASAFQGFVRMVLAAGIGAWIGQQFNGTSIPVSIGFLGCGTASLLLVFWGERGKLFSRPGTTQYMPL